MEPLITTGSGIGFIMPVLVAVVIRSTWPSWAKGVVALLLSVALGAVTAWSAGDLTGATLLQGFLVVLGAAQAAYHLWWKPTGIGAVIEHATQPAAEIATPSIRPAMNTMPRRPRAPRTDPEDRQEV